MLGERVTRVSHRPHPDLAGPLPCGPGALSLLQFSKTAALTLAGDGWILGPKPLDECWAGRLLAPLRGRPAPAIDAVAAPGWGTENSNNPSGSDSATGAPERRKACAGVGRGDWLEYGARAGPPGCGACARELESRLPAQSGECCARKQHLNTIEVRRGLGWGAQLPAAGGVACWDSPPPPSRHRHLGTRIAAHHV
ncbi:hypothetical protein NDU88_004620 [Pleurodeles waltl]|uniref:Uncharacterized protein n=1 Tax=Pleurodeles waltl TaxID=8319 RepID=A0AAV7TSE6_PLEWA|nr:hypothetical protein NDU88_004620 [Pleurodeles waltl]